MPRNQELDTVSTKAQAEALADELETMFALIRRRFPGYESRQHALAYLKGLLSPVECKNGWQLADRCRRFHSLRHPGLRGGASIRRRLNAVTTSGEKQSTNIYNCSTKYEKERMNKKGEKECIMPGPLVKLLVFVILSLPAEKYRRMMSPSKTVCKIMRKCLATLL